MAEQNAICELTTLQWASERLANSERIAGTKSGADRDSWLEDVRYWFEIVAALTRELQVEALAAELRKYEAGAHAGAVKALRRNDFAGHDVLTVEEKAYKHVADCLAAIASTRRDPRC